MSEVSASGSWLDNEIDGRPVRFWVAVGVAIAVTTLAFGTWWTYGLGNGASSMGGNQSAAAAGQDAMAGSDTADGQGMPGGQGGEQGMGGMAEVDAPRLPAVFAYAAGEPIAFVHPEVSDPAIAEILGGMMGSPVITVPALAEVPDAALATVYVFTNGLTPQDTPSGPLGFQPDIFDAVPGDLDYSPLRRLVRVTWADESQARVLTSIEALTEAVDRGLVTLEPTDIVVNAPVVRWPGGQR